MVRRAPIMTPSICGRSRYGLCDPVSGGSGATLRPHSYAVMPLARCCSPFDDNFRHINALLPSVGLATSSSHKNQVPTRARRAAAVTSPMHEAKLDVHDPHAYLRDVLTRLPTQPASRIEELLPHRWLQS